MSIFSWVLGLLYFLFSFILYISIFAGRVLYVWFLSVWGSLLFLAWVFLNFFYMDVVNVSSVHSCVQNFPLLIGVRENIAWMLSLCLVTIGIFMYVRRYRLVLLSHRNWLYVYSAYTIFTILFSLEHMAWYRWQNNVHWPLIILCTMMLFVFLARTLTLHGLSPEVISYGVFLTRLSSNSAKSFVLKHILFSFFLFLPIYLAAFFVVLLHGLSAMFYIFFLFLILAELVIDVSVIVHYWQVLKVNEQNRLLEKTRSGMVSAVLFGVFLSMIFFDSVGGRLLTFPVPLKISVIGLLLLIVTVFIVAFFLVVDASRILGNVREEA